MSDDDEAARKARAERLHRRIEQIKDGGKPTRAPAPAGPAPAPEKPAEFIRRRMRDLDPPKK